MKIGQVKESIICENCNKRKDRHSQDQANNCKVALRLKA